MTRPLLKAVLFSGVVLVAMATRSFAPPGGGTGSAVVSTDAGSSTNRSPVAAFRSLLVMSNADLDVYLTRYPEKTRERIKAKVTEYRLLPPPIGDLRLAVTDLYWYLQQLLDTPAAERSNRLASVPEPYRDLVEVRLTQWQLTPSQITDPVKKNLAILWGVAGPDASDTGAFGGNDPKLREWLALPEEQRRQMVGYFNNFIRMSDDEKETVLAGLPNSERQDVEAKVDPVKTWSAADAATYVSALQKFSNMTSAERARFMRSAERWQKMTESERSAWREIVNHPPPPLPNDTSGRPGDITVPGGRAAETRTNPSAGRMP